MNEPLAITDLEEAFRTVGNRNPMCGILFMQLLLARLKPIEEQNLEGTAFTFLLSDFRPGCAAEAVPEHELYAQSFTVVKQTGIVLCVNTLYGIDTTRGEVTDYSHFILKPN